MDVRELEMEDATMDCVIDKACFDSIACGLDAPVYTTKMLDHIYRVLSPNGVYISISNRPPDFRLKYFERTNLNEYNWKVEHHKVLKEQISTWKEPPPKYQKPWLMKDGKHVKGPDGLPKRDPNGADELVEPMHLYHHIYIMKKYNPDDVE